MSQGNASEWDKLWELFLSEQEPQNKDILMEALTFSKETDILTRYITYLIEYVWNKRYFIIF